MVLLTITYFSCVFFIQKWRQVFYKYINVYYDVNLTTYSVFSKILNNK